MCVRVQACRCACGCSSGDARTHACMHACTHACMHARPPARTHTRMCACLPPPPLCFRRWTKEPIRCMQVCACSALPDSLPPAPQETCIPIHGILPTHPVQRRSRAAALAAHPPPVPGCKHLLPAAVAASDGGVGPAHAAYNCGVAHRRASIVGKTGHCCSHSCVACVWHCAIALVPPPRAGRSNASLQVAGVRAFAGSGKSGQRPR